MTYSYRCFFSVIFCFLLLTPFGGHGQTLRFEKLALKDGLPSSECYKVIQDKAGYVWVFSEYGIVKHNGEKFSPVCTNIAPKDQNAYSVFQTEEGEIYFSNSFNKIFKIRNDSAFSIKAIESFTCDFNLPEHIIFQIVVDTNQDIYFSNYEASYYLSAADDAIRQITPPPDSPALSLHYKMINGVFFSIRSNNFSGFNQYDIYVSGTQQTRIGTIYPDMYYESRKLEKVRDFYLVATATTIYQMSDEGRVLTKKIDGILSFRILDNKIWVLTKRGVKVLNFDFELTASYLEDNIVSDMCMDNNGGIWISTIGDGVYYCRDQKLLSYANTELKNEEILFIKLEDSSLFFSNAAGRCYVMKNNELQLIHQVDRSAHCGDVSTYKNGYLISTKSGLLFKSEKGLITEITNTMNLKIYSNSTSVFNENEFLNFGGTNITHVQGRTVEKSFTIPDKFNCMTPSGQTDYLVGTKRGIYLWSHSTSELKSFAPFFSDKCIMKLIYDDQGNLWVSTKGQGIYMLTRDYRLIQYSDIQSLTINDIDFFESDGIVLSTNQGTYLNHSKMKNNANDWICIFDEETKCVEIEENTIWIAAKSGLYAKSLNHLYSDPIYPIYIHSVYANAQRLESDFTTLAYNKNDLRFNFNFLNYQLPVQKFYYSLNGPTQSSGTIAGNVLQIQNLSPGSYTLNVFPFTGLAYRKDLFISKTFEITPAFWQTYWFRTLMILALVIFSGSLVRYYYLSKRKRERAIAKTNSRIAEYKLTALRAQINPHFVSNSMAAIQLMIDSGNADRANLYIAKFGLLIRYVLKYSDKSITRLSDELKIIDLNIELEQLRFSNNFSFLKEIDEDVDLAEVYVPPLITQPFIENAIWHGLIPLKSERQPTLILKVCKEDDFIVISIIDNGLGRAEAATRKPTAVNEHKESKGTQIIRERIHSINQLYTTTTAEVTTIDLYDEHMKPAGTQVNLRLPATLQNKLDEEHYESNSYR